MNLLRVTPLRIACGLLATAALVACESGGPVVPDGSRTDQFGTLPSPQVTQVNIAAVFSGPPNREPNQVSLNDPTVFVQILNIEQYLGRQASASDVRIGGDWATGAPAEGFTILDINNDGNRDIQLRFATQALVDGGHLGPNTTQITVWGRDPGTGQDFSGSAQVQIIGAPEQRTLSTAPANNGTGGVFMDLTATRAVQVVSFDAPFGGAAGTTATVQVWTRPGSYVGFDGSAAGWTLSQTVEATRQGTAVNAAIVLTTPIALEPNQTRAVYLQVTDMAGGGIRYTGTAANPPQTTWSNADLTLFSDVARVATVAFGGSRFSPRTFSGNVNYLINP